MLLFKEMKKIGCSIPYLLFIAAVAISLYSQGVFHFQDELLREPEPGGNYGVKHEEIPELIMPAAVQALWGEFSANSYTTYPIGFIKQVKLGEEEREKMAEILSEVTGEDKAAILKVGENIRSEEAGGAFEMGGSSLQKEEDGGFTIHTAAPAEDSLREPAPAVRSDIGYQRFQELMGKADRLLGGGSSYAPDSLIRYGSVPLTYEEAKERYRLSVDSDKVTGGYARLFSDYAGVMALSLLPVFLAVILCMKDHTAHMEALIYTKKSAAFKLIFTRYLALVIAVMLPVIVLSYLSNLLVWGSYQGMKISYLAPLKYDLGWLLPSVMVSTAVGMFFTELTGTPVAVALQGLWWLFDLNVGYKTVASGYALLRLAPRHNAGVNSWFRTQDFLDHFQGLLQNRLLFAGMSLLLVGLTVLVYEAKRKGKFGDGSFFQRAVSGFRNRLSQPKA